MNFLRKYIAKDKSTAINLGWIINPFDFSILRRYTPYIQSYSAGNPIPLMKNRQEILQRVPSEALIFKQKARTRNLGNLNVITFSNSENHPKLPSDEDFKKAETMIRELLKPSSTDLPHTVEMVGQLKCRSTKEAFFLRPQQNLFPLPQRTLPILLEPNLLLQTRSKIAPNGCLLRNKGN